MMVKSQMGLKIGASLAGMAVLLIILVIPMSVFAYGKTVCSNGNCSYVACFSSGDCGNSRFIGAQTCRGNDIYQNYITYTCNNAGTPQANCTSLTAPQYQQSCASGQQCRSGGCYTNTSSGSSYSSNTNYSYQYATTNNNTQCNAYLYKKCSGNSVYWYDACDNKQSLFQACNASQSCQNGQCVSGQAYNQASPASHARTSCYGNDLYWYDSQGMAQDIFKSCTDANSCTVDSCSNEQCRNELRCDGSTCAVGSADYAAYCGNQFGQNQNVGNNQPGYIQSISLSVFGRKEGESAWVKNITAAGNSKIEILAVVKNISSSTMNGVAIRTDIANNSILADNVKVDNLVLQGNLVAGIDLGTISPNTSKLITFTGTIQPQNAQIISNITVKIASSGVADVDSVMVTIEPIPANQNLSNVSTAAATAGSSNSPAMDFLKRWYIWMIISIVAVVLFIIIFRKLSSNV